MQYRHMGRSGLRVSEICLGTITFGLQADKTEAFAILDAAADAGVNFLDTADVYPGGSHDVGITEEIVGEWLQGRPRDSVVVATKCFGAMGPAPNDRGLSRAHILNAVDGSLRRLRTDHLDLYQTHFPDPATPIEETLRAFDDLVRWGKVRYIGASNYAAWELALALGASDRLDLVRYQCDQPRYNILFRQIEDELLPLCRKEGVGVIAFNPLAGGFLTGKYESLDDLGQGTRFTLGTVASRYQGRYWHEAQFQQMQRLKSHFDHGGVSLAQAAIAWVLAQDGITSAIVGASSREQIEDSLKAVEVTLTAEDLAVCDDAWYHLPRAKDPAFALQ